MNKVILMGRLTKDPEIRYQQKEHEAERFCVARYTLAVDRRQKKENETAADFISVVAFGKAGEFAEKYLHKGTKLVVSGRIQTGSYTNKDGQKVYTTDVIAEDQEFAESKSHNPQNNDSTQGSRPEGEFMDIPDGIDEDLPFSQ